MIGALLVVALASADGGAADAGFEPVVLDVNHGALWLNLPDGGVSDAPRLVRGGVYADDATAMLLGRSSERSVGERSVGPEVDTKTLVLVGGVMFAIGALAGGALVALWR